MSKLLERVLASAQAAGSIGPGSLDDYIDHSRGFAEQLRGRIPTAGRVLDLGSGGGLPGLVIALDLPDVSLTLLEGRTERARALRQAVELVGQAKRVVVCLGRAEQAARDVSLRGSFDAVVSRGFGPPAVTAECAAPFLCRGGYLICSEPPDSVRTALRWPKAGTALVGLELVERVAEPFAFVVLEQADRCPDRYPRRVGTPGKRPLF